MPLPFILGALAVGTTVLGAAGHSVAKDTNEEAERIAKENKFDIKELEIDEIEIEEVDEIVEN